MDKQWTYTITDLQNTDKQKQVFKEMLKSLEDKGMCRDVFHRLAEVLFNDSLE